MKFLKSFFIICILFLFVGCYTGKLVIKDFADSFNQYRVKMKVERIGYSESTNTFFWKLLFFEKNTGWYYNITCYLQVDKKVKDIIINGNYYIIAKVLFIDSENVIVLPKILYSKNVNINVPIIKENINSKDINLKELYYENN